MDEKEKNEIETGIQKFLLADLGKYLDKETRAQVIIAWELKRIADLLEKARRMDEKNIRINKAYRRLEMKKLRGIHRRLKHIKNTSSIDYSMA